ncbi:Tat binding protein 1-interacting protein-domain-containing protein [Bisporella sp. PMI_857]|nr:Tat binding protein 1-interacting protein-domain-containing protein [Bisporella sp. PMI_857]
MVKAAPKPKADEADPLRPKTERAKVEKARKPKTATTKKDDAGAGVGVVKRVTDGGTTAKKADTEEAKAKPITGDEAAAMILEYLRVQNRPFSATEVSANLRGKVTKTMADKLLKEMEGRNEIMMKATNTDATKKGTQFVFWAIQDPSDIVSPAELAAMDETITYLRTNIPTLKSILKTLSSTLATFRASPTVVELATKVQSLKSENEEKQARLNAFKEGEVKPVTAEEKEKIEKESKYWSGKSTKRKKAFEHLEAMLMDGMSKEEIWERAGLEEDE